jgi:thiamine-monophosphate kinase
MNEFDLIRLLTRDLPPNPTVVEGPGDDCAVLDLGAGADYTLFKTDAVVEGVHFAPDTPPERIGHKALARNLSDFAAMSGKPTHAVVTLGLPPGFDPERPQAIYRGMLELASPLGVSIVGGETTTCPERLFLSIAMIGRVERERCVRRRGAQPGDALFVTGDLGGSLEGRHLEFMPRLAESRWLSKHWKLHSMIDLSDGLAGDLPHLLSPDQLGAELHSPSIPISRAAKRRARSGGKSPLQAALTDGEDFELLFTLASRDAVPLRDAWQVPFPDVRLTCIGRIKETPGITIRDRTGGHTLTEHGYRHFEQP